MRILLPTDSFPPGCGGGGLSAYHLAAGLEARGHAVEVIKLVAGDRGITETTYEGLPVTEFGYTRPPVPGIGPIYLNERFSAIFGSYLSERLARTRYDLVHAQHVLSILPAIPAAKAAGVPVVSTIRDFWPVCFWDTSLSGSEICPGCSRENLRNCTRRRTPAMWPMSMAFIPYMALTLRRRRATLARSDAVICVSDWVRQALLERAAELDPARVMRVPNFVDCETLQNDDGGRPRGNVLEETGLAGKPYLLYAGKLARNKGVISMLRAIRQGGVSLPLVAAAKGELREEFEAEASRLGVDLRMIGWRTNDEVHDLMRGATALLFPSLWPEPLSRVLLEATALGTPIVATATGGTTDIVRDGETGLLVSDEAGFSNALLRVVNESAFRLKLFDRARAHARIHFDQGPVLDRLESVYKKAIASSGRIS